MLDTQENKDEITNICYTLLEIGTNQSILPLTKLLYSNSAYVRSTVIEVLAKIGSDLQIVYIEALQDRNVMVKYEAVRAIYTYGDEMAMRPICERVNKIVARRRKNEAEPTDEAEIIIALRFLHKFANHEEVLKIFDKVYKNVETCLCRRGSGFETIVLTFKRKKECKNHKRASLNDETDSFY